MSTLIVRPGFAARSPRAQVSNDVAASLSESMNPPGPDEVVTTRMRASPQHEQRTRTGPKDFRLTRSGSGMGSAPYMAPEQWNNAQSSATDAELLTAARAFARTA